MEIDVVVKLAELFEKTAVRSPLVALMKAIEETTGRLGLSYTPDAVRASGLDPEIAKKTLMQMAMDGLVELRPGTIGELAMFSMKDDKEKQAKEDAALCPTSTVVRGVIFPYLRLL